MLELLNDFRFFFFFFFFDCDFSLSGVSFFGFINFLLVFAFIPVICLVFNAVFEMDVNVWFLYFRLTLFNEKAKFVVQFVDEI